MKCKIYDNYVLNYSYLRCKGYTFLRFINLPISLSSFSGKSLCHIASLSKIFQKEMVVEQGELKHTKINVYE